MIKTLIAFIGFSLSFALVIHIFRGMTGKETWEITKILGYSAMCALASLAFLIALVVFF